MIQVQSTEQVSVSTAGTDPGGFLLDALHQVLEEQNLCDIAQRRQTVYKTLTPRHRSAMT